MQHTQPGLGNTHRRKQLIEQAPESRSLTLNELDESVKVTHILDIDRDRGRLSRLDLPQDLARVLRSS